MRNRFQKLFHDLFQEKARSCAGKIGAVLLIVAGLCAVCYPWLANTYYEYKCGLVKKNYRETVEKDGDTVIREIMKKAELYNKTLSRKQLDFVDPFLHRSEQKNSLDYKNMLLFGESGIMGILHIPAIDVEVPIYHGTSAEVLEIGCGHLENSSLPVGGKNTHAILTAHTGMNRAKLFTDLVSLKKGNRFYLYVGNRKLTYEVFQIRVILPVDSDVLSIQDEEDLVTLMTCTPYGKNTHRLLVTGRRIYSTDGEDVEEEAKESQWKEHWKQGMKLGIAISFLFLCVFLMVRHRKLNYLIGLLFVLAGLLLYFYPIAKETYLTYVTTEYIRSFPSRKLEEGVATEERFHRIREYNQSLFEKKQEALRDVWSYEQVPTNITCFSDRSFGYVEIPAIRVALILYIGADAETLKKGAAILSQTSIPIGGKNMNCVIAGHRGYQGAPYFREIEELKVGDDVLITNPWEQLTYRVKKIEIIAPDDMEKILIQPGKDMVTLLTCHPYASQGKQRYVVYCERKENTTLGSEIQQETRKEAEIVVSSRNKIAEEKGVRKIAGIFLLFVLLMQLMKKLRENRDG